MSAAFPASIARLFWDVAPDSVDLSANRDYIIERVMSGGGREVMKWLRDMPIWRGA